MQDSEAGTVSSDSMAIDFDSMDFGHSCYCCILNLDRYCRHWSILDSKEFAAVADCSKNTWIVHVHCTKRREIKLLIYCSVVGLGRTNKKNSKKIL